MKKYDELALFFKLKSMDERSPDVYKAIEELDIDKDRAVYILNKWVKEGVWNNGVSPVLGWFETKNFYPTKNNGFVAKENTEDFDKYKFPYDEENLP